MNVGNVCNLLNITTSNIWVALSLDLDTLPMRMEKKVKVIPISLEVEDDFLEKVMETLTLKGYL